MIKKGIVEKDDVLRGKGIDPDEQRLEEAIVSQLPSEKTTMKAAPAALPLLPLLFCCCC